MNTERKQKSIGMVPEEWEIVGLGDIGTLQYGYTASAVEEPTGVRFLRITDVREDGTIIWDRVPYCRIEDREYTKYVLQRGDLVFARIGASSGKTGYIDQDTRGVFASYLIRLRVSRQDVSSKFISYATQSRIYWAQALKEREGQLKKGINATMLSKIKLLLPPILEQQKISKILLTVDNAIQKADEAIVKTERLKKGLMQELLTKGIGHKEYKDTKIGRIPKDWEIVRIGDVASHVGSGLTPRGGASTYLDHGIPLIRSQNVLMNRLSLSDVAYISAETHENMSRSKIQPGDVLLNITGASIGRVATVPEFIQEANVNQHVCRIHLSEHFLPSFASYYISSRSGQNQIMSLQGGATRQGLNYQQVRSLLIPRLPSGEQQEIVNILSTVDIKLNLEKERKEKLERIKKGLLNELLTGRRRVKV